MSDAARLEGTIAALSRELRPVRRLPAPMVRALGWLAVVLVVAAALARWSALAPMMQRLAGAPDMWLAMAGACLTAVGAVIATFQTSVPGRARAWALLPLPGVVLWLGASGLGCLRSWAVPAATEPTLLQERTCLFFIIGLAVPLLLLLLVMVRRAAPLRPHLTAALAGLASAAASAALLNFFHPYDAALTDIVVHVVAVAIVIGANSLLGRRLEQSQDKGRGPLTPSKASL